MPLPEKSSELISQVLEDRLYRQELGQTLTSAGEINEWEHPSLLSAILRWVSSG